MLRWPWILAYEDVNVSLLCKWFWRFGSDRKAYGRSLTNMELSVWDGNRSRVLFWDDKWCGDRPWKNIFNNLHAISWSKTGTVQQHLVLENGMRDWDRNFRRGYFEREMQHVILFIELIGRSRTNNNPDCRR
ncbi:hypothetical protein IFM89_035821 [Coptis chinensis]|uniref:Reverse transcriptase zinc-binding domain-containing protein n=1 Tax=Coptis chinensis TaxID=261450 RepID=A0A835I5W4_9MAGN|nr:hypothetical protein IFM89_035821 [Coptis chinensis]